MVAAWIDSEFASLDLGDARRERRAGIIVEQFTRIAESTPDACQDKAALEATYRLARNPAVRPEAILQAQQAGPRGRAAGKRGQTRIFHSSALWPDRAGIAPGDVRSGDLGGEQIALANPETHYVNVADSESDIHEIYTQTSERPANYDFVIRSC